MPTHSPALQALLEPLTTDTWVQCDSCEVWRRVPNYVSERLGDNDQWCVHGTRRLHFERSEWLFSPVPSATDRAPRPVRSGQTPATRQRIPLGLVRDRDQPIGTSRPRRTPIANFASRAIAPPSSPAQVLLPEQRPEVLQLRGSPRDRQRRDRHPSRRAGGQAEGRRGG